MLGKLLGIASLGGTVAGLTMLQKFLAAITTIVTLTIISAMMGGLFLICGFSLLYLELTRYGLDPAVALMLIGGVVFVITLTLVVLAVLRIREMQDMPVLSLVQRNAPTLAHAQEIAESFLSGLLSTKSSRAKSRI